MQDHPLKTFRDAHTPKLSQAALAEILGVARLTVNRWENGDRKIDPDLVPVVSEKTGIPAKDLRPDIVEKHIATYGEAAQ
jgi:DNA-binding transcriptional regulator YdaS (Cro superfamily)